MNPDTEPVPAAATIDLSMQGRSSPTAAHSFMTEHVSHDMMFFTASTDGPARPPAGPTDRPMDGPTDRTTTCRPYIALHDSEHVDGHRHRPATDRYAPPAVKLEAFCIKQRELELIVFLFCRGLLAAESWLVLRHAMRESRFQCSRGVAYDFHPLRPFDKQKHADLIKPTPAAPRPRTPPPAPCPRQPDLGEKKEKKERGRLSQPNLCRAIQPNQGPMCMPFPISTRIPAWTGKAKASNKGVNHASGKTCKSFCRFMRA